MERPRGVTYTRSHKRKRASKSHTPAAEGSREEAKKQNQE